jgi:hypothetical protein
VAAVVIRRRRWLVARAPVIAAGSTSGIRTCEWHSDSKDHAGEQTRNDLAPAELPHAAHLPSAFRAQSIGARDEGTRNGAARAYSQPDAFTSVSGRPPTNREMSVIPANRDSPVVRASSGEINARTNKLLPARVKIKTRGRAVTVTSPGMPSRDAAVSAAVCDVCAAPRPRGERRRLVWDSGLGGDLVLADLCGRCAAEVDRLLELYGGHGRNAIRLTQADAVSVRERAPVRKVGGIAVRGLFYLLIALASFLVVTFVTARG